MSTTAIFYLVSSDSTEPVEQSLHYAYKIIRIFPGNVPTDLAVLYHYGETNDIFFPGGLVELSSSRCKTVQACAFASAASGRDACDACDACDDIML
jgi:hypothetical protein